MFLLVWYYCTLTIRESILKVNGSRIKGWWRFHHFLSTVVAGVLLIWPNTGCWYAFRGQFMWFNVYISKPMINIFAKKVVKLHNRLNNNLHFFFRFCPVLAIPVSTGRIVSFEVTG